MPDDQFLKRQIEIEHGIKSAEENYYALWSQIIREWQNADEDRVWLSYSANYLLHTAGVKWALDPYSLFTRLKKDNPQDFVSDLGILKAVVLSHAHSDHLDLNILSALAECPILWIVPSFMYQTIDNYVDLKHANCIIPQPGVPIIIENLKLTPFESLHFRDEHGVPEMGYKAEFSDKCWVFPGDLRIFSIGEIPEINHADGVIAHLWLGHNSALENPPPLLKEFCDFFIASQPIKIIITHLEELGRDPYN
jgi:L-ascorbate metabolism protein UlaG (beta-lactamase superfamily)